jgi:hypothetical protein
MLKCLKINVIGAFLLIFSSFIGLAQLNNSAFNLPAALNPGDSNKLFLGIENGNYFKNNYYYNNFEVGYKEIGWFLQPSLEYYPTGNTRLSAGVHMLKYSGLENLSRFTPVLSFQYRMADGIDLVLGTIYGTTNHRLIEPVFQFDRYNINHVENGFQFLFDKKHVWSDLWMNWETFIFDRSPIQERFTVGTSTLIKLNDPGNRFQLQIPLQTLITHRGGMHTIVNAHVQTYLNYVYGIDLGYNLEGKVFQNLAFRGYMVNYQDLSFVREEPYTNGSGFYPNILIEGKFLDLMLGYWNAQKFIASRGEYLFQSVSEVDSSFTEEQRRLLTFKFTLHHTISRGIEMGARLEAYMDLKHRNIDYTYTLFISFNRKLFLHEMKSVF